jgi:hypothetical protein
MRRRHSRSASVPEWPLALRWLIHAAERECPRGHAGALRELTALALRKVPSRGLFDPGARSEHELYVAIESIARTHLELEGARSAWRGALQAADLDLERRDGIERAALQLQSVSDTAYFYAGLAFGLAYVHGGRP